MNNHLKKGYKITLNAVLDLFLVSKFTSLRHCLLITINNC